MERTQYNHPLFLYIFKNHELIFLYHYKKCSELLFTIVESLKLLFHFFISLGRKFLVLTILIEITRINPQVIFTSLCLHLKIFLLQLPYLSSSLIIAISSLSDSHSILLRPLSVPCIFAKRAFNARTSGTSRARGAHHVF